MRPRIGGVGSKRCVSPRTRYRFLHACTAWSIHSTCHIVINLSASIRKWMCVSIHSCTCAVFESNLRRTVQESKKYGSSKSTSPALEKEYEKRPTSQQPSTDTSLVDTAVSAPTTQAAETETASAQQQHHQKVGASEAKATMGGMIMADPAKEGLGKGGKLSRLDVGGGVGGDLGADSSSPVLSSAFSSISSAPSTGQQRSGVMGWLGGQGAGGKDRGSGGTKQSPGSRNSPSRDAIRKAIERGLHETNGGVATGSTHRTEANTSFASQSMAEISEISGSEREGTPDPSLSGAGKHLVGGSGNKVISPSIVEAESTVQLGGRERRKVASLVQVRNKCVLPQNQHVPMLAPSLADHALTPWC